MVCFRIYIILSYLITVIIIVYSSQCTEITCPIRFYMTIILNLEASQPIRNVRTFRTVEVGSFRQVGMFIVRIICVIGRVYPFLRRVVLGESITFSYLRFPNNFSFVECNKLADGMTPRLVLRRQCGSIETEKSLLLSSWIVYMIASLMKFQP